jgi:hypothetical protein
MGGVYHVHREVLFPVRPYPTTTANAMCTVKKIEKNFSLPFWQMDTPDANCCKTSHFGLFSVCHETTCPLVEKAKNGPEIFFWDIGVIKDRKLPTTNSATTRNVSTTISTAASS